MVLLKLRNYEARRNSRPEFITIVVLGFAVGFSSVLPFFGQGLCHRHSLEICKYLFCLFLDRGHFVYDQF